MGVNTRWGVGGEWGEAITDVIHDAIEKVAAEPSWEPPTGNFADLFRVKIEAHSVGSSNEPKERRAPPLVSYKITAPRIILAEINTHRVLSKSSESSRAIPGTVRVAQVGDKPYRPLRFGLKTRGMGAGADLAPAEMRGAAAAWEVARTAILAVAGKLLATGLAKEEFNRLLEPWALCRTILTGTEWANFFALRTHDTASPPFRFLARAMYIATRRSTPKELNYGEWHAPFINTGTDLAPSAAVSHLLHPGGRVLGTGGESIPSQTYCLLRWSSSRCARISFGLPGGKMPTPEADDGTWANLTGFDRNDPDEVKKAASADPVDIGPGDVWPYDPVHASPMEHQATPMHPAFLAANPRFASNLFGWLQFRRLLGGETARKFNPPDEVVRGWEGDTPDEVFNGPELY